VKMKAKLFWGILFIVVFALLSISCNVGENSNGDNPVPVLNSLSPGSKAAHMPGFKLTALGANFVPGSKIVFNGTERVTQYIDDTQLSCGITSGDLPALLYSRGESAISLSSGSVPVLVRTPAPGGGDSGSISLDITDNHFFTSATQVSGTIGSAANPAMVVDTDGNIAAVYESFDGDSSTYAISFIRSTDSGATWSAPINLVEASERCNNPDIAIDSNGFLSVIFYVQRLYYLRSIDNGMTWNTPVILSGDTSEPLQSALDVDNSGGINIVWTQQGSDWHGRVNFTRSSDDGTTFSAPINIFAGYDNYSSTFLPVITVDNLGGIYAGWGAWPSGGSRYGWICFNYSHDNGITWSPVDTEFPVASSIDLAIDPDSKINIAYSDSYLPFANQILFLKSNDRGASFEPSIEVTADSYDSFPLIAIDSAGNINIIYFYSHQYYFKRSIDGGATWSDAIQVTNSTAGIDMTLDQEGNIYILFENDSDEKLYFTWTGI
jgi:BNR/Asp-box repeat